MRKLAIGEWGEQFTPFFNQLVRSKFNLFRVLYNLAHLLWISVSLLKVIQADTGIASRNIVYLVFKKNLSNLDE